MRRRAVASNNQSIGTAPQFLSACLGMSNDKSSDKDDGVPVPTDDVLVPMLKYPESSGSESALETTEAADAGRVVRECAGDDRGGGCW